MTVDEYAEVLRNPALKPYDDSSYTNASGKQGYRATFRMEKKWYWYSVSDTTGKVSPLEVARTITSRGRRVNRSGPYKTRGFEATVRYESHSYMLNEGDTKPE
jgi:hypothetical protein